MKGEFPSGPANGVWAAIDRLGVGKAKSVSINSLFAESKDGRSISNGIDWLIHFKHIEVFTEHGTNYVRKVNP